MNRRGFLFGLGAALVASPAIVRAATLMPVRLWAETLYGDGIHDDAPAIEALIRGERVALPSWGGSALGEFRAGTSFVMLPPGGVFRIGRPLEIGKVVSTLNFDGGLGEIRCDQNVEYLFKLNHALEDGTFSNLRVESSREDLGLLFCPA